MRRKTVITILLVLASGIVHAQPGRKQTPEERFALESSFPPSARELFRKSEIAYRFDIYFSHLNPFYLWGDFDGDDKEDFVIQLTSKRKPSDWRIGVLFGNGKFSLLQRDSLLEYPGPSAWFVIRKSALIIEVDSTMNNEANPDFHGDAIEMIQPEASSTLIYWNGKRFVSNGEGD